MKTFLGGQDVWEAVEEEYVEPKNLAGFSQVVMKAAKEARVKDQKALSLIQLGVDDRKYGILWRMLSRASTRVFSIVNQLERNGEEIKDGQVVKKILRSLNPKFDQDVVAIKESKDIDTTTVDELSGELQVHEDKIKGRNKDSIEQALQAKMKINEKRGDTNKNQGGRGRVRGRGRGQGRGRGCGISNRVRNFIHREDEVDDEEAIINARIRKILNVSHVIGMDTTLESVETNQRKKT
ncbi:hypothetical protein RJ640_006490 [Escallonia rubra]|uniref:Uncharacterized protein n=1 Tax=Escallonia rubra TaxID=112253 RepID=A0AA88UQ20_9ASTE|nr:hypothetical protein RJ640_006490 [Escallonia rubra]